MMGIPVGDQVIEVIDRTRNYSRKYSKRHLPTDKPPEVLRQWLMYAKPIDSIDDESADNTDTNGKKCH
jgi:hypothetical protein